ncbi:MAG: tetratricopeptide repeat protein, partial [Burkholderiales bacterium]|nr:tetratricopeptide repeat protein [Burkholderiales bacterium]
MDLKRSWERLCALFPRAAASQPPSPPSTTPAAASHDGEWLESGLVLLEQGKTGEAEAAARSRLDRDAADVEAAYLLGRVFLAKCDTAQARAWFEKVLAHDADCPLGHHGAGLVRLAIGDTPAALRSLRRAVELRHDYVDALVDQALAHLATRATEDAADCLNLALAFEPGHARARVMLSSLLIDAGELDAAEDVIGAAHRRNAALDYQLARLRNAQGRTEEAAGAIESALRASPRDPALLVNLGLACMQQLGDPVRAGSLLRAAVDAAPGLVA